MPDLEIISFCAYSFVPEHTFGAIGKQDIWMGSAGKNLCNHDTRMDPPYGRYEERIAHNMHMQKMGTHKTSSSILTLIHFWKLLPPTARVHRTQALHYRTKRQPAIDGFVYSCYE